MKRNKRGMFLPLLSLNAGKHQVGDLDVFSSRRAGYASHFKVSYMFSVAAACVVWQGKALALELGCLGWCLCFTS